MLEDRRIGNIGDSLLRSRHGPATIRVTLARRPIDDYVSRTDDPLHCCLGAYIEDALWNHTRIHCELTDVHGHVQSCDISELKPLLGDFEVSTDLDRDFRDIRGHADPTPHFVDAHGYVPFTAFVRESR